MEIKYNENEKEKKWNNNDCGYCYPNCWVCYSGRVTAAQRRRCSSPVWLPAIHTCSSCGNIGDNFLSETEHEVISESLILPPSAIMMDLQSKSSRWLIFTLFVSSSGESSSRWQFDSEECFLTAVCCVDFHVAVTPERSELLGEAQSAWK